MEAEEPKAEEEMLAGELVRRWTSIADDLLQYDEREQPAKPVQPET